MPVVFNPFTGNLDLIDNTAAAGSDTQVQFNDGGVLGGDGGLVFNKTTNALTGGAFIPTSSTVPTNGVYLPGTNQVALSTNGTGRLFVDASGNVGVGVAGPAQLLHINSAGTSTILRISSGSAGVNTSTSSIQLSSSFSGSGVEGTAQINANAPAGGQSELSFLTSPTGNSPTERLRITSAGLVGVGTSSPGSYDFDGPTTLAAANTAGSSTVAIVSDATSLGQISFADGTSGTARYRGLLKYNHSTDSFEIRTAATPAITIDSSQRVGIGNSSPGANLDIYTSASRYVRAFPSSGLADLEILSNNNSQPVFAVKGTGTADLFRAFVNTTQAVTIDSSGRLGIGTTSPFTRLHVNASSGIVYTTVGNDNGGTQIGVDSGGVSVVSAFANNAIRFGKSSGSTFAETMRLDSSGRLLVGTSSSNDTAGLTANVQSESGSNNGGLSAWCNAASAFGGYLALGKSRGTTAGSTTIVQQNDSLGTIYFFGADGTDRSSWGAEIKAEVDGTPGANDMPGRLVFSVTADGAFSPTERCRIDSTGWSNFFGSTDVVAGRSADGAGTTNTVFSGRHSATSTLDGTLSFLVYTNGNVVNTNNSYGAISDIKLKENIVDASSQWDDIKGLRPVNYNFKEGQTHTQLGLIAQEVELVSPGLVTESPDRDEDGNDLGTVTKSVNYSVLYMKAVKALQEAMERIETLEAKVAALESA